MVLAGVIALQFLRYCTVSFPYKSLPLEITTEASKIAKNVPCNLTFIFIDFSEIANSFVNLVFCVCLVLKNKKKS